MLYCKPKKKTNLTSPQSGHVPLLLIKGFSPFYSPLFSDLSSPRPKKNSIFEWWGAQRAQLGPRLPHNGDRGLDREEGRKIRLLCVEVYSLTKKYFRPFILSVPLSGAQAHHKDKMHSNQSGEYPLCCKKGEGND